MPRVKPAWKRVAVIVVGDEILAGEVRENNATFMIREVNRLGSQVERITVLPDDETTIAAEVKRISKMFDTVLVSGGIGVTHDDVTRQAVARAFRLKLVINRESLAVLKARYGPRLGAWQRKLAELPPGCRLIRNPKGTAPGFVVRNVYVFPGVPHMLKEMFPGVAEEFAGRPRWRRVIDTSHAESSFAGPLTKIAAASPGVGIGSYPQPPGAACRTRLVLKSRDRAALETAARKIERMLARRSGKV